jgi:hypothetical protein
MSAQREKLDHSIVSADGPCGRDARDPRETISILD